MAPIKYAQDGCPLAQAVAVLKARAARNEPVAHCGEISEHGLALGDEMVQER